MKNTIERIQDSIDDIKTAINTKYLRNGEEAPIEDDTLLEEYALAIDGIEPEIIDISQQIFVFYCWATNEADAKSKTYPTITWEGTTNKWSIKYTPGGWSISADEEELDPENQTDAEKYLYAMFVSVNTDTNSGNRTWPDPVRLTGKTGAKGEDGSDGRDGVIAGLTLRNIITLYRASDNEPEIKSVSYEQGTDLSQLIPSNIKIDDEPISSDPTSSTNQKWSQTYEINPDHPMKIWKIDILYSSKSEATLLGNCPILITNTIDVEIEYGTSISPEISPDTWSYEYPANINNIVWIRRKEKLSDHTVTTIEYPIGLRGPAGIQFIGSVESKNDLSSISPNYDNDYIGKLGIRVGQDVYVWYGTEDPNLTGAEKIGSNYWLNVGLLSPIPDWNAQENEMGYIENRTHYVETITKTFGASSQASIPTSAFNITISYGSEKYNWNNIWHIISEESLPDGVTFKSTDNTYYFDSSEVAWECSYQIIHQLDPKFVPQMIEISYSDLKNLKDTNQLIPGQQYRITDYITTTLQENTQSARHQFDIIVAADDESTLNENARAILHDGDTYFENQNLAAWELKYCIDNDTTRWAWAINSGYLNIEYNYGGNISRVFQNTNQTTTYEGVSYELYYNEDFFYEYEVPFEEGYVAVNSNKTEAHPVFLNEDRSYEVVTDFTFRADAGKGVIYYMKDEYGNECPYDFKNIMFIRYQLGSPGGSTTDKLIYQKGNMVIDCISNLGRNSYVWSGVNSNHKLWDDLGEVVSNPTGKYKAFYTFSGDINEESVSDWSLNQNCKNNVIKEYIDNEKYLLNNNVFFISSSCKHNFFDYDCSNNSLDNSCSNNYFGIKCEHNIFGTYCSNNSLVNSCNQNLFGDNCSGNSFDVECINNYLFHFCKDNYFENKCKFNAFDTTCKYNNLNTNCTGILIKSNSFGNKFGNNCTYCIINESCEGNAIGASNYHITLDNETCYNIIGPSYCTSNTNTSFTGSNNMYIKGNIYSNGE